MDAEPAQEAPAIIASPDAEKCHAVGVCHWRGGLPAITDCGTGLVLVLHHKDLHPGWWHVGISDKGALGLVHKEFNFKQPDLYTQGRSKEMDATARVIAVNTVPSCVPYAYSHYAEMAATAGSCIAPIVLYSAVIVRADHVTDILIFTRKEDDAVMRIEMLLICDDDVPAAANKEQKPSAKKRQRNGAK